MRVSKTGADDVRGRLSRQRKFLTLFIWAVGVCMALGVYTLLVRAMAHGAAGEARVPLHSLAVAATPVVKIDPALKEGINPGETFSVTVMIQDVEDLGAFQFELTHRPSVVTVTNVTLGPFLGSTGRSVGAVGPTYGTGTVTYGAYSLGTSPPGPNGDGVLSIITLRAISVGTSTLHLQNVAVTRTDGRVISTTLRDGEVRVGTLTAPNVMSITPNWGYRGRVLEDVILMGEHFQAGLSVQLTKSGQSPISAASPVVQSSTRISCTFNLGKAVIGKWTVRVTNPDDQFDELQNGFTVKAVVYLPAVLRNY